jgi:hypothetical protein
VVVVCVVVVVVVVVVCVFVVVVVGVGVGVGVGVVVDIVFVERHSPASFVEKRHHLEQLPSGLLGCCIGRLAVPSVGAC